MRAFVITSLLLAAPPSIPPPPQLPTPEFAADWDEARYIEYIARQDNLDLPQLTPAGCDVELSDRTVGYEVAYDTEWREAISQALLISVATEKAPGVWLLCPDGRTEYYMQCMVVIQNLRAYGVPMRIRTLTVPATKEHR